MNRMKFYLVLFIVNLGACASVSVTDYEKNLPKLELEKFFDGNLVAEGIVKNRSGRVTRTFTASIRASWKDSIGSLDEQFEFDDGEQQSRVWTLTPIGEQRYIGTATDVIGESLMRVSGNSVFLNYQLRVLYQQSTIDLIIDDRMYLITENVLINESTMSKWGFEVGSITLVIRKSD